MGKKFLIVVFLIGIVFSCSSDDDEPGKGTPADNFDRGAMLVNIADNIIIPSFQDFSSKMNDLKTSGQIFSNTPDQTTLDALRLAWYNAYKVWQYVELFNIGKAEEIQYRNFMNIYPLSVSDVENNIANGGYDLDNVNFHDAQGFPAIDYLLNGVADNDIDILAKYTTDPNNAGYKLYVSNVLDQMDSKTQQVVSDWLGTYRDTFVSNTGNTATSSVNKLVNDYIYYYEKGLRANKFGIPAGVFSPTTLPDKVEAFYKEDISKELSQIALMAVTDFFNGKHYGSAAKGESFSSYLIYLEREDISTSIKNQLDVADDEINGLLDSYYIQVMTDNTKMTMTFDELQKVVVLFKVDMVQAFNISIDYIDADGD